MLNVTTRNQCTIRSPVSLQGFGYWSGQDVKVHFRPARAGSGIQFVRSDLRPLQTIRATVHNRIEIPRRTALSNGGASVEMIEHVMAALTGLGIDNCEVWVSGPELPGFDGSSQPFVEALLEAGMVTQEMPCSVLSLDRELRVGDEHQWVVARPCEGLKLEYQLDYGADTAIGRQHLELAIDSDCFQRELAAARTFLTLEEADLLRSQGLGQRVTPRDLLIYGPQGPIDNELRYPNECVRHKMLDLLGDLALAGCTLHAWVVAYRSGHRLNAELVRTMLAHVRGTQQERWSA